MAARDPSPSLAHPQLGRHPPKDPSPDSLTGPTCPVPPRTAERSSFTITGGSGASLAGVFFTPEANPFKVAGGGNWGQQHAQFISYQLTVTGGGILTMAPDPTAVVPPTRKGYLIR